MEIVKRYIYAVTHKLPEKQRADIEQELQGLIEDMLEHRTQGGEICERDVEEVLLELGAPHELAAKYKGNRKYLISPELFDLYWVVLKIVILSIVIGLSVVAVIEFLLEPVRGGPFIGEFVVSLITSCVQGFAWVTIAFGIVEYNGVKASGIELDKKKEWKPSQLPAIPNPQTQIKRSEPIASIIFTLIITILFTASIQFFGIINFNDEGSTVVAPFFNEEAIRTYFPLLWGLIALSILKDGLKLVAGRWTARLAAFNLLFNIASLVILIIVFSDSAVWNPEFLNDLVASGIVSSGSEGFQTVSNIWNNTTDSMIYIIAAITIIDTIWIVWKMYRIRGSK
ncbi:hypothetical protein PAECIP111893_00124 [Paenibacillus plantiphilus]|uniref:Uncharacterized protein n=1 Tax=Paenibacillus plantiphilus TaxID=2905650 RepID=A0ABN8FPS1_9BACL|nr:hypothetical protein [Paenibacillus plantiphilus]CAH1190040.1 hypothetical protein PAECIP111893_00124 [Paenibacillus plantiphilus]